MLAKQIANALRILKAADPKVVEQMIADDPTLLIGKAEHAVGLDAPEVVDLRTDGQQHAVPTREEIKTGPGQSASGAGAERMIREYSRPAPQAGVTTEAMRLADILEDFGRSMKAMADATKAQQVLLTTLVTKAADEDAEEDEEEKEAKSHSKARAETLISRAKKLLAKAEDEEEKEDEEDDDAKSKAHRRAARGFKKRASMLLGKAQVHALAADSDDLKKAIRLTAAKFDIAVKAESDDDEEDDEDKSEKARQEAADTAKAEAEKKAKDEAEAAAKAEADKDSKGNQADKQNKENYNQDDSAQKAVNAMSAQVEEALKGLRTLQGNVASLMDTVAGRSRNAGADGKPAPVHPDLFAFVKADPRGAIEKIQGEIEKAVEGGALDGNQEMLAMNLLSKVDAFQKGVIAKNVVDGLLSVAPAAVQQIFNQAA